MSLGLTFFFLPFFSSFFLPSPPSSLPYHIITISPSSPPPPHHYFFFSTHIHIITSLWQQDFQSPHKPRSNGIIYSHLAVPKSPLAGPYRFYQSPRGTLHPNWRCFIHSTAIPATILPLVAAAATTTCRRSFVSDKIITIVTSPNTSFVTANALKQPIFSILTGTGHSTRISSSSLHSCFPTFN